MQHAHAHTKDDDEFSSISSRTLQFHCGLICFVSFILCISIFSYLIPLIPVPAQCGWLISQMIFPNENSLCRLRFTSNEKLNENFRLFHSFETNGASVQGKEARTHIHRKKTKRVHNIFSNQHTHIQRHTHTHTYAHIHIHIHTHTFTRRDREKDTASEAQGEICVCFITWSGNIRCFTAATNILDVAKRALCCTYIWCGKSLGLFISIHNADDRGMRACAK